MTRAAMPSFVMRLWKASPDTLSQAFPEVFPEVFPDASAGLPDTASDEVSDQEQGEESARQSFRTGFGPVRRRALWTAFLLPSFCKLLAVAGWGHAKSFSKDTNKMRQVTEACGKADVRDLSVGVLQKIPGCLQTIRGQILQRGSP